MFKVRPQTPWQFSVGFLASAVHKESAMFSEVAESLSGSSRPGREQENVDLGVRPQTRGCFLLDSWRLQFIRNL